MIFVRLCGLWRWIGAISGVFSSIFGLSCCIWTQVYRGDQFGQADDVVCEREGEDCLDLLQTADLQLMKPTRRLATAEDLLDPLATAQDDRIEKLQQDRPQQPLWRDRRRLGVDRRSFG